MLSPGLSSLEMDSNTSMSAPSPASVSMDGTMSSLTPPPPLPSLSATSSHSGGKDSSALDVRVLQHRVSKTVDKRPVVRHSSFADKLTARVHMSFFFV